MSGGRPSVFRSSLSRSPGLSSRTHQAYGAYPSACWRFRQGHGGKPTSSLSGSVCSSSVAPTGRLFALWIVCCLNCDGTDTTAGCYALVAVCRFTRVATFGVLLVLSLRLGTGGGVSCPLLFLRTTVRPPLRSKHPSNSTQADDGPSGRGFAQTDGRCVVCGYAMLYQGCRGTAR